MKLTSLFVHRPTLVFVFLALVTLAGTFSAATLVRQQFPSIEFPAVNVSVSYSGASTTEMRDAIVRPIEDQIAGAPDLDHITTHIQQGTASITAVYALSSNQDSDLVETQRAVQAAQSQLPNDLTPPTLRTFNPDQEVVVTLVVTSTSLTPNELSAIVTSKIIPTIEQLGGISNVNASGTVTPSVEVRVHPGLLSAAGLTLNDVVSTIGQNNIRAPGGIAYGAARETTIDIRGDITGPESVAALALGAPPTPAAATTSATSNLNPWSVSPRLYRVGDVASVASGYEPQRIIGMYDSRPAISLEVQKAVGASEVTASNAVLQALPKLRREFPDVQFGVSDVASRYTQQQLADVLRTLVESIALTAVVMLFFLRSWRNAAVVLVAIPTSLLVTLTIMRVLNFTIDTVSLLAMTLIIGILVDDSIVVLENVERHFDSGEDPQKAAIAGRSEIGLAAIVITLVDVVVFLPISFLPGTVGKFMAEFGIVVVVATLTSLGTSFTVTPALAGRWSLKSHWRVPRLIDAFTHGFDRLRGWYVERALPWGIRHRWIVVGFSAVTLIGAIALVPLGLVGFEFIPNVDRGQLTMQIEYPPGTPLTTTQAGILKLTHLVDRIPDLKNETSATGAYRSPFGGFVTEGAVGQILVNLKDNRKHSTVYWVAYLRQKARSLVSGADVVVVPATGTGGGNAQPIDFVVTNATGSPDAAAQNILGILRKTPGAVNVTSSASRLAPQVSVEFDRSAARVLDVSIGAASTAIRAAFGGALATQYTDTNGRTDVQVIYPRSDQTSLAEIERIPIRANNGSIVHVGDIATLLYTPAPPVISRVNRQTVIHVGANVAPGYVVSNVLRNFEARLARAHMPSNIAIVPNTHGNQQNLSDTVSGMTVALALALVLVFLLMVALFNSYRAPFVIIFAVPVAVVGALGSLALTHQTLNLFSLIGTVLLIGLVTKNGILLVDFADRALERGRTPYEAIREAAQIRFRPIVMTTVSMVAGMLPLALAIAPGSESRQSLGTVVIGGLLSSLLLTLLLVPVVFMWLAPKPKRLEPPADGRTAAPQLETERQREPIGAR
ncbi:MAG: efflux RND transporter permease subunit [Candidatus Eremiobacteraeota bacterium]|nr:efflux RND transporter permease subunit [Candidatus Eremiobacteraeota bacterium]